MRGRGGAKTKKRVRGCVVWCGVRRMVLRLKSQCAYPTTRSRWRSCACRTSRSHLLLRVLRPAVRMNDTYNHNGNGNGNGCVFGAAYCPLCMHT